MKALMVIALTMLPPSNLQPPRNSEIYCLAHAIYHEARGESLQGQTAVAHVVLNRVLDSQHPDTICNVVYQKQQFSNVHKTYPDLKSKSWRDAVRVAVLAYTRVLPDPTKGARFFFAHRVSKPFWCRQKEKSKRIGSHEFYY